ncbi:GNAT family N-acetyltransferase [Mycolicibacterium sp. NCC-Tsukiji]|uniref:GNAT family N-acetyltransferase n=1 Tax=Mycolicibacterium sp. NCC-Tsukiji TaxID=2185272 RepID=UPI000EC88392|nr:N-acetyltransferase [Mycolicibacterium sp. NCC-Tsukiji]GCA97814.1 hypothetical protein NCCNTM_14490 [Mycolicibacterium sp. NCC-Tsukiji]
MSQEIEVRTGGVDDVDELRPVWLAVHRHHAATMPELAPYVDDDASWRERRALYIALLDQSATLLVTAVHGPDVVGYGMVRVLSAAESWVADTWVTGPLLGEIESLGVLPGYRGAGLGSRILDHLESHLQRLGVDDVILGVLPGNAAALRLYRARGYRPTWTYLSRFADRPDRA